jgi:gamma-glutamyltranspeptidase / glutathione hydrolase
MLERSAVAAVAAALMALMLAGCAQPPPALQAEVPPEAGSGYVAKDGRSAQRFMVAAANPLATEAGYEILRAGGSAVDAAIAVQMVLALVEPQSSGIGGGALLMHSGGSGLASVQAWDGRETAPAAADARMFLGADGKPVPYAEAVFGGRAVATPGVLKMLEAAHREHGQLPWARLFARAIVLAEDGFAISPRLHSLLAADPALRRDPLARGHFYQADGSPHPLGYRLRNPALAALLRLIAKDGSSALHTGAAAADMAARVQRHAVPGTLSVGDLARYLPVQRPALCSDWLTVYRVCGFPPPSSGHLTIMQTLGILALLSQAQLPLQNGAPAADWLHVYLEATRLAYADRAQYIADPAFVSAPGGDWLNLLDAAYLAKRAALIGPQSMKAVSAGQPAGAALVFAPMAEQIEHGTSHISVVDAQGRAVAMTSSIEAAFGARVMTDGGSGLPGGYLLNNQMTDFALAPTDAQGRPVANRIEPGKRPRSSMSPTLVFDRRDGRLVMTLGSPGGPVIIPFTAKTLIGTLQWRLTPQGAIDLPNFGHLGGPVLLETGRFERATVAALKARGHAVAEVDLPSGLQAIQRTAGGLRGGADPRREGVVLGD